MINPLSNRCAGIGAIQHSVTDQAISIFLDKINLGAAVPRALFPSLRAIFAGKYDDKFSPKDLISKDFRECDGLGLSVGTRQIHSLDLLLGDLAQSNGVGLDRRVRAVRASLAPNTR